MWGMVLVPTTNNLDRAITHSGHRGRVHASQPLLTLMRAVLVGEQ